MKGVVFTEFLEMLETRHSPEWVDELLATTSLATGGAYTAVGTYPCSELAALVGRHAAMSGQSVADVLRGFGRHLFGRFAVMYPVFFNGVSDTITFLSRIEGVIHVEVLKLYPDAELPRFEAESDGAGGLRLRYRSERNLADLAEGLMEGCVAHYGGGYGILRHEAAADGSVLFHVHPLMKSNE